jgi:biopolymer transport protein ExbD
MKFPRRTRLLRNPFDATAYAAVFFLMVIFLMLGSRLYTPGVKINLPVADHQPGTDRPTLTVAMDESGRYFFQNQIIESAELQERFTTAAKQAPEPLTLVILMDKATRFDKVLQLQLLARDAGIADALIATLPRASVTPVPP